MRYRDKAPVQNVKRNRPLLKLSTGTGITSVVCFVGNLLMGVYGDAIPTMNYRPQNINRLHVGVVLGGEHVRERLRVCLEEHDKNPVDIFFIPGSGSTHYVQRVMSEQGIEVHTEAMDLGFDTLSEVQQVVFMTLQSALNYQVTSVDFTFCTGTSQTTDVFRGLARGVPYENDLPEIVSKISSPREEQEGDSPDNILKRIIKRVLITVPENIHLVHSWYNWLRNQL